LAVIAICFAPFALVMAVNVFCALMEVIGLIDGPSKPKALRP
jgi:hypothetical protein